MKNRDALVKAREILEVNLKQHNIPQRADIRQLVDSYPMKHTIRVLDELIKLFPKEDT